MAELEASVSAAELAEWRGLYAIDPWGDQRADMRMARIAEAAIAPHIKHCPDAQSFMLFPEDAMDLPDDVNAQERAWMMQLQRTGN